MKLIHKSKKISLFLVLTLFSIILFGSVVTAALNINLEEDDNGFDRNVTIKSTSTGFVPYLGAVADVNLGVYDFYADWVFAKINWSYIQNIPAGYIAKIGGGPYLYNDSTTIYFNDTFGNNTYVPYTGATKDVDLGANDFYANATYFTENMSIAVNGDAEIRLDTATNQDSCLILQETDTLGINFCYDGSGTNRWVVGNNNGTILFEIERETGETIIHNHTTIEGNLTVDDYVIGDGSYITNLNLSSVNDSFVPYTGAIANVDLGVNNISAYMGNFTDLYVSNATLYIGNVSISANDSATKSLTLEAGAEMIATTFVGDGSQLTNISFENGSANFNGSVTAEFFNSSNYYGGNFTGDNFTGDQFCNATDCFTLQQLQPKFIKKYATGNFTGSLYTSGANSTPSTSESLFQVVSDTRGTPQFQVQDGGPGQASLMVRSWIVVNQNNTLLNSSQNNLCADWGFEEIDCNTSTTGADFGVTDDLEVLNLIHAGGGVHTHTNPGGIYLYAGDGDQYSGSNGSYTYATDLFCDTTDSPFLDVGGWLQIIAEGTVREGLAADIDSYANASCIYLKNNPGWNESFSGVTYEVINNPDLVVLDEGFMEYYVGDNPKSQFKVKVKNGTGSTGILFDVTAGVDQHMGFELQVDAKGYDGIVGQNIYMKSSIPLVNKEIIALLIEGDASNMNNSHGTFIDLNAIGVPLDLTSTIDGIHFPAGINNILESGSADVLASAYYNSTNITANVTDVGNDAQVFVFDNDVLYIGGTTNFTSLSVALTTGSNIDLSFTYSYCNSSYDWQTLAVTDTTSGFKTSGTITFLNPSNRGNCSKQTNGVPFSDTTNYTYIALTRTRNTVIVPPTIDRLDISGAAINMFMKEDMLRLNPVDTAPETCVISNLGAIYYDISEDDMCVCKTTGWKIMMDGTDCT